VGPTNDSAWKSDRDPTEVVELALIEARYMLLEANIAVAILQHHLAPPSPACRDMSPFGR
jgi:hypothetical protein